jgi:hypothetical protein
MAPDDDALTADLLADLWDLVEGWSSGAIQRARDTSARGPSEVAEAETRLLMEHAAALRAALEDHLDRVDAVRVAEPDPQPTVQREPTPQVIVPEHRCDSADYDRPPCAACSGRHWFCSICGAQRDECPAAS